MSTGLIALLWRGLEMADGTIVLDPNNGWHCADFDNGGCQEYRRNR